MKQSDIISLVGVAIIGFIISYFLVNILIDPDKASVTYKSISPISSDVKIPENDSDMFNINAYNPTLEVGIGGKPCDVNKDGRVSDDEKKQCKACDADGDGILDKEEQKKCREKLDSGDKSECDVNDDGIVDDEEKGNCRLCDKDGDGEVDYDEKEICEVIISN